MNENDREMCLKEISSELLDNSSTVNISTLSENWALSMKESSETLETWLAYHGDGKPFYKQYLVRGAADCGTIFMTIVPERNLVKFKEKHTISFQMLYSVKEGTEPSAITIPTFLETKRKRLVLKTKEADREPLAFVKEPVELTDATSSVKQEGNTKLSQPKTPITNGQSKTNNNNNIQSMFKNVKNEKKTPTKHETSNNNLKTTPKKKSPAKKDNAKKITSIGTFFAAQSQKLNVKIANGKVNKSGETSSDDVNENGKRSPTANGNSEDTDNKVKEKEIENPPKRRKLDEKKKMRAKGSRIMIMEDSDDDEEAKLEAKQMASEESEVSEAPIDLITPPEKTNGSSETVQPSGGTKTGRAKKRRMVTKTYEDEDGFIKTVKESEEYSCSEPEDNEPEPVVNTKKATVSPKSDEKKKVNKTSAKNTKTTTQARKPPTKQGSITNFFSKK